MGFMLFFSTLLCLICLSLCCFYESHQAKASLNDVILIDSASSEVECILECQNLKQTSFYTDDKKCYCIDSVQPSENIVSGTVFKKVCEIFEGYTLVLKGIVPGLRS